MAKPICVIYWPENTHPEPSKLMLILNGFDGDPNIVSTDYWKDYLWFCFEKRDITEPEFKVFHEKDFTETQYNELKSMIEGYIKGDIND